MALIKKKKSKTAAVTGQAGGFCNRKKVVVAMSPKENLRFPTGQAGGCRRRKKVVVAMSGGVDSSVAAALLKKEGYSVVGIFMKFWSEPKEDGLIGGSNRCCSLEAENRARKVAKILNVPFYVFNFEKEFKKRIVDCFLADYKKGITPNPCVVCNKEIKFGLLLEKALRLNADFIATGHYARIKVQSANPAPTSGAGRGRKAQNNDLKLKFYKLLKGKDRSKDQSYFLWQLSQRQLKRALFPVGDYKREEVEKLAKKFKLPFSRVKKSQEICFIPKSVKEFLRKNLKPKPGPICLEPGSKQVGEHQGLYFYTIGQRKGIRLPGGPYYVLDKDFKKNILIVTKREKDLLKKELIIKNINWISGEEDKSSSSRFANARLGEEDKSSSSRFANARVGKEPVLPLKVKAKIRYRQKASSATIIKKLKVKAYQLKFTRCQRAITPGQSAVFYSNQGELLGGGIII